MDYAEELKRRAEEVREKHYAEVYEQIKMMMAVAVEQGKRSTSISYKFFKGDNALLKYIIERCLEDDFVLRLYEARIEIRLEK